MGNYPYIKGIIANVVGVGDLNGDGDADLVLQRASDGLVEIQLLNGTTGAGGGTIGFEPGAGWTIAAVADFNGDGRADLLWRDPNGNAYLTFMNGTSVVGSGYISGQLPANYRIAGAGLFDTRSTVAAPSGTTVELLGTANGALDTSNISTVQTVTTNSASLTTTVGNSTLIASANSDVLQASAAMDGLFASGTADTLIASGANDILRAVGGTNNVLTSGSNDTLVGGSSNDTLTASGSGDTLIAGSGTDTLIATGSGDFYQFGSAAGQAIISNGAAGASAASNELDFLSGLTDNQLWLLQSGNDLRIDLMGSKSAVTVSGWFAGAGKQLQEITAGGLKLDTQVTQLVQAMAAYTSAHPGFDPTLVSQMPNDSSVQSAIAAAWHH